MPRRADGTWLVQVPAQGFPAPLVYALPDDATKALYVERARRIASPVQSPQVLLAPALVLMGLLVLDPMLVPLWTMALVWTAYFAFSLLIMRLAPRREEALHAWLAAVGETVNPREAEAGGMVLRRRQETAEGWQAMRPAWVIAIEVLGMVFCAASMAASALRGPARCSRWNEATPCLGFASPR